MFCLNCFTNWPEMSSLLGKWGKVFLYFWEQGGDRIYRKKDLSETKDFVQDIHISAANVKTSCLTKHPELLAWKLYAWVDNILKQTTLTSCVCRLYNLESTSPLLATAQLQDTYTGISNEQGFSPISSTEMIFCISLELWNFKESNLHLSSREYQV